MAHPWWYWQPISTISGESKEVLIDTTAHARGYVFATRDASGVWRDEDGNTHYPTHWMLPPLAPQWDMTGEERG